ncbi:MAG: hypothetical protein HN778_03450 [Prolixibacteraceae bacterium]|jgi:hypothetical protein|nr:hypothetical protein [Prolixibacteraceae bacterium]MBT4967548.1 hypothetical protein [Bacteroidota bacterium]MBT6764278.1 hypothetical protein [Prolixibacteraceae bacterium]MBT7000317.1 hypothetical protein [Prolixibacteraceae bacterium]MBT7393869.1 hypothetical protein [Prolixibacteraceae bacterium]
MKKSLFIFLGLLLSYFLNAQEIPQKISYQGKLYENNSPVNEIKSITFTIGSWTETHSVQITNGLYSVQLGSKTPIPVSTFNNSVNVDMQIAVGGNNLSPQTDILSVPYAFKAERAVEAENVFSGNYNDLINRPTKISNFSNDAGYITDGNTRWNNSYGFITSPNDADANPNNEIQNLSIDGDNLSISNGNSISLPSSGGGLILPYSGLFNGRASSAFEVENGTNATTDNVLRLTNYSGTGRGAFIDNRSSNTALLISNEGTGRAIMVDQRNSNSNYGLEIESWSKAKEALYVRAAGSADAAHFDGNVNINGTLSKSRGTFKIDHPLDPENKYLYHSFIESPDMMNIYNGNVVLDENGSAKVVLPDWFEALNIDFRYQLTCIGGFAQIYISEKISNNSFKISGGQSGLEVSWQVTGIRNDPYADQNRIQVEVEKTGKEIGRYLHYKEYNQPLEKSISDLENSEK